MGEIKLDYESSMQLLTSEGAGPDDRAIAACAVAFFMAAEVESNETVAICQKLMRMTAGRLDDAKEPR